MSNPILEELYDIRQQILADHRDDLTEFLRAGLEETKASGHPVAKITQRTIRHTRAATVGEFAVENLSLSPGDR